MSTTLSDIMVKLFCPKEANMLVSTQGFEPKHNVRKDLQYVYIDRKDIGHYLSMMSVA